MRLQTLATTLLLPLLLALESCTQDREPKPAQEPDRQLLKARAMQALVCVQMERTPSSWKSDFHLAGPGSLNEIWQTISEQPPLDHGVKISSVYRQATDQLYLVIQGGFPETIAVYGPISAAPECQGRPSHAASAA